MSVILILHIFQLKFLLQIAHSGYAAVFCFGIDRTFCVLRLDL